MGDLLQNPGRREVLRQLALGAGGLLAVPFTGAAHPIQQHLHDAALVGVADANAQASPYAPEFLSPHQLDTLRILGDRIVPGSSKANSAEFVDQLLAVASGDEQREFLRAMGALEQLAMGHAGVPWKALSDQQQHDLLTRASTEKAGATDARSAAPAAARATIRDHFEHLKGWIVGAYYSSEIGMRELGWTGSMFFPEFPGCTHEGGHP